MKPGCAITVGSKWRGKYEFVFVTVVQVYGSDRIVYRDPAGKDHSATEAEFRLMFEPVPTYSHEQLETEGQGRLL